MNSTGKRTPVRVGTPKTPRMNSTRKKIASRQSPFKSQIDEQKRKLQTLIQSVTDMDSSVMDDANGRTLRDNNEGLTFAELHAKNEVLYRQLEDSTAKVSDLETDLQVRQMSYIRRETELTDTIDTLKHKLSVYETEGRVARPAEVDKLRRLHHDIQQQIDFADERTLQLLREKERSLTVQFRGRLNVVEDELKAERSRDPDADLVVWLRRFKEVSKECDFLKGECQRLHDDNDSLADHLKEALGRAEQAEANKDHALKHLLKLKRENNALKIKLGIPVEGDETVGTPQVAKLLLNLDSTLESPRGASSMASPRTGR